MIELGTIESLLKVLKSDDIDENEVSMTIAARVTANLCDSGMCSHSLTSSFRLAVAFSSPLCMMDRTLIFAINCDVKYRWWLTVGHQVFRD